MCNYITIGIKAVQLAGAGKKMIDTYALEDMIRNLYEQINDVYFDIARSHLKSAERSIDASRKSTNPDQELFATIHHLYDSYEILQPLLTKTRTYKELFFFTKTEDVVKDKMKIYNPCFKISALIYMLYHMLGQSRNANDWELKIYFYKEKLLEDFYTKYGSYARFGKRKSCKCPYTCYEFHHRNSEVECPDCYTFRYCNLDDCSSCTKKCRNYIEDDEIEYNDSSSMISEEQYNNLYALSDKYVKKEIEEHRDYIGYGDDCGEIYDEYISVRYFILAEGQKYCREKELAFKQNIEDFIVNTKENHITLAQELLKKLITI